MWTRVLVLSVLTVGTSLADEATTSSVVSAPTSPVTTPMPTKPQKKKKAPRIEQKENEGTQAKNRFEADSILKSEYHINGQPLEVDPD